MSIPQLPGDALAASRPLRRLALAVCFAAALNTAAGRTFEFDTTEVTQPGVTAAPDGESIVFNLVGHLFRLPVSGGNAVQLTTGPYYDSEPVFSPDGKRLAFVSSRDENYDANLFVLDLGSGKITQLTHEFQVGMPAWSADGKTIAYLSFLRREEYPYGFIPGFTNGAPELSTPHTISAQGGASQKLGDARPYGGIFILLDGRVAWTVMERTQGRIVATVVEARKSDGTISQLGTIPGAAGKAVSLAPGGGGIYFVSNGNLELLPFGGGLAKRVGAWAGVQSRIDPAKDGKTIYGAANAKLWRIALPEGNREMIELRAHVKMEGAEPLIKKWTPPSQTAMQPRVVLSPILSADGRTLIFMAAGWLWEESLDGGAAKKLFDDNAFQCDPALSPDGRELAYTADDHGKREIRVYDFATRQTRTLVTLGGASWPLFASWSADGKKIVFQRTDQISDPYRFIEIDAAGGSATELANTTGEWTGRPQFSADAKTLYFSARMGTYANFYRLDLAPGAKPEPVTALTGQMHDGLISPDGKWLAFRRNTEIWIGALNSGPLKDGDFTKFSAEGGRSFRFTSDSKGIVYSEGRKVWRKRVPSGPVVDIPVHLTLSPPMAAPLLLTNIRILSASGDRFADGESMLIEQGRIRWIGKEAGRQIPSNAIQLDGGNRYAVPGIADSHEHTAWANQQITEDSLIAYGVTSVRDTGSRIDLINAMKDRGDSSLLPVPRYFAAGDIFEGVMPLWGDAFLQITTKEEAREEVRRWKSLGADFIKLYTSLPWYLKSTAAEEAHRLGMPTVGHGLSIEEIVRSINLGFETLEHEGPTNDDRMKLEAAAGVKWDPTRTVSFGYGGEREKLADPETLDAKFNTFIPEDSVKAGLRGGVRPGTEAQRDSWKRSLFPLLTANRLGIDLLDGTDALMTSIFFGPSVHWEMQFFADADIRPSEILKMATIGNAETVGASADLGTLEPGKLGDLVLLDANPLEDIHNTMKIWRVIKGGEVFDPAKMRK